MFAIVHRRIGVLAIAGLTLSACASGAKPGTGPITLSPGVQRAYAEYLARDYPLAFAVSTDGRRAGYVYCPEMHCLGVETSGAVYQCEKSGRPCYVYAWRRDVVWDEAQPAPPPRSP